MKKRGPFLLGIDAGTTSLKAVLFDVNGKNISSAVHEYKLLTPDADLVELDAQTYWIACKESIRRIVQTGDVNPAEIKALAVSSQGESFVPVDGKGKPLRRAIVWLDNRSQKESGLIRKQFGADRVYHITGSPDVVPTWAATKIMWLRDNEPDIFRKVNKYLFVEDYLIYKLTGQFVAEGALYSSSLLFDINAGKWWGEMLDFIGIAPSQLPALMKSGKVVGELNPEAAEETGLCGKTVVVTGGMDQACGSIGSGNIEPGIVTEITGASLNICVTTTKPVFDPKMRIPCQYHAIPGKYICLPWCATAGMVLKWFRDEFCETEKRQALKKCSDAYELLAAQAETVKPGSEGLIMLPHLAGAMSPELDPKAKGVFYGISLSTTKAHFIRAIMESVAFMLKNNLTIIEELGIEVEEIRSLGGAAKSDLWNQIKADVTQKSLVTLNNPEAACLGAAILAGTATGIFVSIKEACKKMISVEKRFEPDLTNRKIYERTYGIYLKLYENLRELFQSN